MRAAKILVFTGVLLVLIASALFAKYGNVGIYAIVDKVVFEPNEDAPQRVQIWGLFVVPVPMSSGERKAPERGVLYFSLAPDREGVIRKEWAELKKMAGTGQILGFTNYWVPNPDDPDGNPHTTLMVNVRKSGHIGSPDVYPLEIGVERMIGGRHSDYEERIIAHLKEASFTNRH